MSTCSACWIRLLRCFRGGVFVTGMVSFGGTVAGTGCRVRARAADAGVCGLGAADELWLFAGPIAVSPASIAALGIVVPELADSGVGVGCVAGACVAEACEAVARACARCLSGSRRCAACRNERAALSLEGGAGAALFCGRP